jgi:hypothetical protein
MTSHDRLIAALKANGIAYPQETIEAARKAHMHLWVACANLQLETSGGANIFGHDPTSSIPNAWKGTRVTRWKYAYYRSRRVRHGLQGVGPCQLTSRSLQVEADRLGGCWKPECNMTVGFRFLHNLIVQHGSVRLGFQYYNGSGSQAIHYGYAAERLCQHWEQIVNRAIKG